MSSQHIDLLQKTYPGRAAILLKEVSLALPISPKTLSNKHFLGKLEFPTFKVGKLIFVSLPSLAAWLDQAATGDPSPATSELTSVKRGRGRPRKTNINGMGGGVA